MNQINNTNTFMKAAIQPLNIIQGTTSTTTTTTAMPVQVTDSKLLMLNELTKQERANTSNYLNKLKTTEKFRPYRAGPRDTQKQVDFLAIVLDEVIKEGHAQDDINVQPDKLTKSQFVDILFSLKKFSIGKISNTDLQWYKDSKDPFNKYRNSTPTRNNSDYAEKTEMLRLCLLKHIQVLAKTAEERAYIPTWADMVRVPRVRSLMECTIASLLIDPEGPRNIAFSKGFARVCDFYTAISVVKNCNLIILSAFSRVSHLFVWNGLGFTPSTNSYGEEIKKAFGAKRMTCLSDFLNAGELVDQESFLTYGMHLDPLNLLQNYMRRMPSTPSDNREEFKSDSQLMILKLVSELVNTTYKAMGQPQRLTVTWEMIADKTQTVRDMTKTIRLMKAAITYIVAPITMKVGQIEKPKSTIVATGINADALF
jgi:hypothetical protein